MASSLALRRLLSSTIVPRSVRPAASLRHFNTNEVTTLEYCPDENRLSNRTVSPRDDYFFPDMFHPPRPLSKGGISFMDQVGQTHRWDVKEKDDALHLRIDMPGLSREDVKLSLEENNILVIKGEGDEEEEEDGGKFSSRIGLSENVYKTDEIKAEMKNGVLKVVVPKLKDDERLNVRHIQIN
ncbi:unnamed protein product [Eruca vesicaria subsp. sativa]|uniref:SHSP domain-containing protein n=1 Tax=Eruca vesicaria subsp. sativa TaxID=29727 RepID=A0ABC8LFB3_ERUVS|nr:unnamed protein product [Eruca vesicaria subsp. sativa]